MLSQAIIEEIAHREFNVGVGFLMAHQVIIANFDRPHPNSGSDFGKDFCLYIGEFNPKDEKELRAMLTNITNTLTRKVLVEKFVAQAKN